MRPHFICIGSQKAGTDWIYDMFGSHCAFWKHPVKELHFFTKNIGEPRRNMARRRLDWMMLEHGRATADYTHEIAFLLRMIHIKPNALEHDFSAYYALFENKPALCFDCTPTYTSVPEDMARHIYADMPDTRFLLVLRDPVARLWSQAQMHERHGWKLGSDVGTLERFAEFANARPVQRLSFLAASVEMWRRIDRDGRLKILFFDDLVADPAAYLADICAFLGVAPDGFALPPDHNRKAAQGGKRAMPPDYEIWAARHFREEYARLARLLGGHAARWHERNEARLARAKAGAG